MVALGGSARFGTFDGTGFALQFQRRGDRLLYDRLREDAVAVRGASVDAVTETVNTIKQRIRSYITAHFTGSEMHGNGQRRVANASAQSKFYDDIDQKGQYAGLVYSKFGGGHGPAGFVDFLLLHVRGGTLKARSGDWLRIPNWREFGPQVRQTGFFPVSRASVFFAKSDDGRKLYLLRRLGKSGRGRGDQKVQLLATLVRSLVFPARLSGIDEIARSRGALFEGNFATALRARGLGE